jgi:4-hydroxybenzoate polyprenyltransferase
MLESRTGVVTSDVPAGLPLAVDLDGTLLAGDTLHEGLLALLLRRPLALLKAVPALGQGRAAFKRAVALAAPDAVKEIPVRPEVLAWLQQQRDAGRELHLVTAADQSVADALAERLEVFDSATGSDGSRNLSASEKARWLAARFPDGFAYIGNSAHDLKVFAEAREIALAACPGGVARQARALGKPVLREFEGGSAGLLGGLKAWLRAMRPHQWSKNLLLFVPLVLGHRLFDAGAVLQVLLGFLAMSLAASGTYMLNDLADLQADRRHATKRRRPIAAGLVPALPALAVALLLIMLPMAAALAWRPSFGLGLAGYVAVSLSYSGFLKRQPLLDTLTIAGLFMTRLGLGVLLAQVPWSPWLMSFAGFFFFSLALAKRHGEVMQARNLAGVGSALAHRGYRAEDWPLTLGFGLASAMAALQIMILFVANDAWPSRLYSQPVWLYATPAVMAVWLTRLWLLAHRQELHDDPVVFALRDPPSWLCGLLIALAIGLAL